VAQHTGAWRGQDIAFHGFAKVAELTLGSLSHSGMIKGTDVENAARYMTFNHTNRLKEGTEALAPLVMTHATFANRKHLGKSISQCAQNLMASYSASRETITQLQVRYLRCSADVEDQPNIVFDS
jgi:hypothetical protein